jgi:hypothetical protein
MALASFCDVMSVFTTVAGMRAAPTLGIHFAANKAKGRAPFIKPVMLLINVLEKVTARNRVICSLA